MLQRRERRARKFRGARAAGWFYTSFRALKHPAKISRRAAARRPSRFHFHSAHGVFISPASAAPPLHLFDGEFDSAFGLIEQTIGILIGFYCFSYSMRLSWMKLLTLNAAQA